jgi:hypothetical protein
MDSESGGGKTTLFIVVFFLCVISVLSGYFYYAMSSSEAEAQKKLADIQAKAAREIADVKSEEEKREIQRKADLELEQAKIKVQTDAEKKALASREAKIKAAEAAVKKKMTDAAATVKNAQNLQNQAKKVKADADKKNKDAAAAMAKAAASGKAVDKKLADEKKKLAADAKKKVDAANKAAATAKAQATAEAKKAIDLQKRLNAADAKLRGKNYERSGKYGAVPGYYRTGATWGGDHFGISDPNWCRNRARQLGFASWGHRNASHPATKYKNSCYFYKTSGKYQGDGNDDIHMVGCAFGGNPKTGCRTPKMGFVGWNYQAKIDFPHNDRWYQKHSNGSYNRKRSLNRCASEKGCAGVTCSGNGKQCWGKNKLLNRRGHGDRYTWITKNGWK